MKYCLILSLAFFYSIPSDCITIGKSSNTTRFKWAQTTKLHCKRFKCPPVEDLVCVRMRNKKLGSKTKDIFMLLINKCEMEYLKCHQGYHAAEVPMKNCGSHDKLGHSVERRKRSVRHGYRKPIKRDSSGSVENTVLVGAAKEPLPFVTNDNESNEAEKLGSKGTPQNGDGPNQSDSDKARIYEVGNVGKESEAKPNDGEKLDEPEVQDKEDDQIKEDNNGDDNVDDTTDVNDVNNHDKNNQDAETGTVDAKVPDNPDNDNGDNKKDTGAPDNYDLTAANEGVDFEEYEKDCPSTCPAREVMICARCQDGIYRTFMSSCHLRMFNCAHPDEKTELVSRLPCVLSAPYLAEVASPKGRVAQPGDVDEVLKFIRCREKKELGRDDPKCKVYNNGRKKQLRN